MRKQSWLVPIAMVCLLLYGCGGGSGATGSGPGEAGSEAILSEGIALESIPPEDRLPAGDLLVPAVIESRPPLTPIPLEPESEEGHVDWVLWPERLAANVLDADNSYSHTDQLLTWPGVSGATKYFSRADCSGFVTRTLRQAFAISPAELETWLGSSGPSSRRYHDNILVENNITRIRKADDVRRGDIVAIRYLDNTEGGTGHTMIALAPAQRRAEPTAPLIEGTVQYELRVVDSTSSPHGSTDSRRRTDPPGNQPGAGIGTIRLYADGTGAIVGYTWSLGSGSNYFSASFPEHDRRSLVVGRLRTSG